VRNLGVLAAVALLAGCGPSPTIPASSTPTPTPTSVVTPTSPVASPTPEPTPSTEPPSAGPPQWVATTADLTSAGQTVSHARLAVDPAGNAVVVWTRIADPDGTIKARTVTGSGFVGPSQTLSEPGQEAAQPHVATDASGNAVVAWACRCDSSGWQVQLRTRAANGSLGTLQTLTEPSRIRPYPQVAVDPTGRAVVAWAGPEGIHARVRSVDGTLGPDQTLSTTRGVFPPARVGMDQSGNAIVVWKESDGSNSGIQARVITASGGLGSPQTLSAAGRNAWEPQVAVGAGGNAVVVWQQDDGANWRIWVRAMTTTGTLGVPLILSALDGYHEAPHVALGPGGSAVVVWDRVEATGRIEARAISASGELGPIEVVSAPGDEAETPLVAVDPEGDALLVWDASGGSKIRTRSASGTLGAVESLPTSGVSPGIAEMAFDGNGNAAVLVIGETIRVIRLLKVRTLSASGRDVLAPSVAMDPDGNGIVAWQDGIGSRWRIRAQAIAAVEPMGATQTLSGPDGNAVDAEVVVNTNGLGAVVWRELDESDSRIVARVMTTSGTVGEAQTLSAGGPNAEEFDAAIDATGATIVVWLWPDGPVAVRAMTASGVLGTVRTVSGLGLAEELTDPRIAVAPNGDAVVVWREFNSEDGGAIEAVRRSASGALGTVRDLSGPGKDPGRAQVALFPDGSALIVWDEEGFEAGATSRIAARTMTAAGQLGPAEYLSGSGNIGHRPVVAVDQRGTAVVVWRRIEATRHRLQIRERLATGELGTVETLAEVPPEEANLAPQLAIDPEGNALVVWQESDGSKQRIKARIRTASGTLGATQTLSPAGQDAFEPHVAVDANGNAVVVWRWFDGQTYRVQLVRISLE